MMGRKIKNKIGIRYGRLIVIKFAGYDSFEKNCWLCKCDCGKETIVRGENLQSGHTKSCGCLHQERVSEGYKRENNPNYKDTKIYTTSLKAIKELKEKIRKQAGYKCRKCNKTQEQNLKETDEKLSVHHIDSDDTNNIEENLMALCKACHTGIRKEISNVKNEKR